VFDPRHYTNIFQRLSYFAAERTLMSQVTIDIVLITAILGFHHLLVLHGDKTLNSLEVHGEIEWNPEARE
jgi:hypothetical protein